MLDTMTLTKVTGGVCGTLLIFLLGNWAAEELYATGGHGDHEQAYLIETGSDDHGGDAADAGPSFGELYAEADADKGKKVFGKCKACHKLEDGANSTGPYLYGVVGRPVGTASGYGSYSGALNQVGADWTPEALDKFLANPKKDAPGTTMAFAGLKKEQDRANLIAYLDLSDGSKTEVDVPAAAEGEAPAAVEGEAPAADEGEAPAATEGEASAAVEGEAPAATEEEAPAAAEGEATETEQ